MAISNIDIDVIVFKQYLGNNINGTDITQALGIDANTHSQINKAHQHLYSYLIKHIKFMESNIMPFYTKAFIDNQNTYDFIWTQYNTIIQFINTSTTPKSQYTYASYDNNTSPNIINTPYTYPSNTTVLSNYSLSPKHYDRTIYQNVIYILEILGKFNHAPKPKIPSNFNKINEYIDIFDGQINTDTYTLKQNILGVLHDEYLVKYKNEIELLKLCKDSIIPYIMCDDNYLNCVRLQEDIYTVITNLPATPINLYDICNVVVQKPFEKNP